MIRFLFFGRLEYEKGIDIILDAFSRLYKDKIKNRHLDIYGDGSKVDDVLTFANYHPDNVNFHGRAEQNTIRDAIKECDFVLMPSRVLESFGLAALETLFQGKSVIGLKKGGIEPFIHPSLDIQQYSGDTESEKLLSLLTLITTTTQQSDLLHSIDISDMQNWIHSIVNCYTVEARTDQLNEYMSGKKNILLVSDYKSKLGGIESQLFSISTQAKKLGYNTAIFGRNIRKSSLLRKIGLLATGCNFWAALSLQGVVLNKHPDVIWLHSVTRYLGRLPIKISSFYRASLWYTIHDLGILYPYGAKVEDLGIIPEFSLHGWTRLTDNRLKKIPLALKYWNIKCCMSILRKHAEYFFVPSHFMVSIIAETLHIPLERISVMPNIVIPIEKN